jgi:ornithine carbamoyltransferase
MLRHFVDLLLISAEDARSLVERAIQLKREGRRGRRPALLSGRTLGLVFEKPSLRTRVSFEAAIARLGGNAIFLRGEEVGLGVRESVADCARVLGQYVDALAVRTFSQATVEELARSSAIPVINALSDASHPCQAMSDLMTITELKGTARGQKVVFVGEGNNVARSLAVASALMDAEFLLSAPPGYEFPEAFRSRYLARFPDRPLRVDPDPRSAVVGADVVYTDVWASMGQEHEAEQRRQVFEPYQVNDDLLARAKPDVAFLHCLPAHRGEEVTASVLDGPHSQVILQAANRLHLQMALLIWLLAEEPD